MAEEIDLIPEFFEEFKKMRHQRIFEYKRPPAGISQDEKTREAQLNDAYRMRREIQIAEILMTLESDFLDAFSELSKDKLKFWLAATNPKV